MKKKLVVLMIVLCTGIMARAQYNALWIPDTISGTTFNLNLRDTFVQYLPGNQTITAGVNGAFWGPTLIFQKGDTVHMNVHNYLSDSTTVHWHGMHLPAIMDGGPHQIIPPGTIWQPYWCVTNNASTFWYHPHLHTETQKQITAGLGGFIIIRDSTEATLPLPRTYGVDDLPLVLTTRSFDAANAFTTTGVYGDYVLTNGVMNAQVSLPRQYVRLRILNAEIERGYNLGFSDNRTFWVIGNDGGLLDAPVAVTRVKLLIGERAEILVNLGTNAVGDTVNLEAFNAGEEFGFPGSEPSTTGEFGSILNNVNFSVLHINVAAATAGAITSLPTSLVSNTYWTAADAMLTRSLTVTQGTPGSGLPFSIDNTPFVLDYINKTVGLNNIEQWTVTNNNVFGHSFHIHDIQFKIISRSSGPVAAYESGWKDTYYLHVNETVSFVAKFTDYADPVHPFMYHCHIAPHEDGGMMGQFVVDSTTTGLQQTEKQITDFNVYPNPATNRLYISLPDPTMQAYYLRITNAVGHTIYMLPTPQLSKGIDISTFAPGEYFLQLTDDKTKNTVTKKFTKL